LSAPAARAAGRTGWRRGLSAALLAALAVPLIPATAHAATMSDVGVDLTAAATELEARGSTEITVTVTNHGSTSTPYTPVVHVRGTADDSRLETVDLRCGSDDVWGSPGTYGNVGMGCVGPDYLRPGESLSFTMTYTAGLTGGTETLTAATDYPTDSVPGNDVATVDVTAEPYVNRVDLWTELNPIAAPQRAGELIQHAVRIGNLGDDHATDVRLVVNAAEDTTFVVTGGVPYGATCTGGASLVCDLPLVYSLDLPETITFTTVAPARAAGVSAPAIFAASVTSDLREANTADNQFVHSVLVAAPARADLGITAASVLPGTRVGGRALWPLQVRNNGPDATDAIVSATVPAGLDIQATAGATLSPGPDDATTITWNPITLAAGATAARNLLVEPVEAGSYTVTAAIDLAAGTGDPNTANNTVLLPLTVAERAYADLSAAITGPSGTPYPGVAGTWTVSNRNSGPDTATTNMAASFPAGLTVAATEGGRIYRDGASTSVVWPAWQLNSGESLIRKVTVVAPATGSYSATATAALAYLDGTIDDDATNDTATSAPVTVVAAPVARTVTVSAPATAQWSDTMPVDVTVRAANGASTAGTPVTVTAFGRTYTVTTGADGKARAIVAVVSAPGTRATINAKVAASGNYLATASPNVTTTVVKEDGQLGWGAVSGGYRKPTTVAVTLRDSSVSGYTGARREPVSTATRGDVRQGIVTVKVYRGSTLVATFANRRMGYLSSGIGQVKVAFTPTVRGTYTVYASTGTGSWYQPATVSRTIAVR
jgi:hypothetical protein